MASPTSASGRTNTAATDRLRALPALFRGSDLTDQFQWTSEIASTYLWRWKQRRLVAALGGHSDVFANLLVGPHPNWEAALLVARPSAMVIGVEVLRRAGWTTQIPTRPEVAIDRSLPLLGSDHFVIERRSDDWFERVKRGRGSHAELWTAADAMQRTAPCLRPAWALADMLATSGWGACGLHPDDIDFNEAAARDRSDWLRASQALGVPSGAVPGLEGGR